MKNPFRVIKSKILKLKTLFTYFSIVKEQKGFTAAVKFIPKAYRRINRKNTYIK
jgi:hypothetical protein